MKREFSNEFVREILTLLDRIEVEEDHTLASQRFDIAEKHGFTVIFKKEGNSPPSTLGPRFLGGHGNGDD